MDNKNDELDNYEIIRDLLREKKILESKLYYLNDRLYNTCSHEKWLIEHIENPNNYNTYKITYCDICELEKRR